MSILITDGRGESQCRGVSPRRNVSITRMHNRRFTRLTNAFSKKFESHVNMVALYTKRVKRFVIVELC